MRRLKLCLIISIGVLLYACVPQIEKLETTTVPDCVEEVKSLTIEQLLNRLNAIKTIKGTAEASLKTPSKVLSGDASITINNDDTISVKIYSLGVQVGELGKKNGATYSNPEMTLNERTFFVNAIKDGLLWWKDVSIQKGGTEIKAFNKNKVVKIDKASLLPMEQRIILPSGYTLKVKYKEVLCTEGVWFPSQLEASIGTLSISIAFDGVKLH